MNALDIWAFSLMCDYSPNQPRDKYGKWTGSWSVARDVTNEYINSATPGSGTLRYTKGYNMTKKTQSERAGAKWLHDTFGGNIRLLTESGVEHEQTADYLWRGKLWELKTIYSSSYAKTDHRIEKAYAQISKNRGGILLDYSSSALSVYEAKALVLRSAKTRVKLGTDIIIRKGEAFMALRFE